MLVLLVAGEPFGGRRKHNVELGFPVTPTVAELAGHVQAVFRTEAARDTADGPEATTRSPDLSRPAGARRFVLEALLVFDDARCRWLPLAAPEQLHPFAQLYAVRRDDSGDTQAVLPPALRLRSPLALGGDRDPVFFLYHDLDFTGRGALSRPALQRAFAVLGLLTFSDADVAAAFDAHDVNRDGVLSYAEFVRWMRADPAVCDALLDASEAYWDACDARPASLVVDSSCLAARELDALEAMVRAAV